MSYLDRKDEEYLQARVAKGQITQQEYEMIVDTPQVN